LEWQLTDDDWSRLRDLSNFFILLHDALDARDWEPRLSILAFPFPCSTHG
jgi:hypothetical protein